MDNRRKDKIRSLILEAVEEINDDLEKRVAVDRGAAAPLYGKEGVLDSLSLVSLIVAVEQAIDDEFDVAVTLADSRAMSEKSSPFRTAGSLTDYALRRLEQASEA